MVKAWLIIAVVPLVATDALAQSVMVTAGGYHDIQRFSGDAGTDAINVLDTEANGLHLAVGAVVIPHCTVAVEAGFSGESIVTKSTTVTNLGQTLNIQTQYANQPTTWSALVGLRSAPAGRLQLTYLGGVTFSHVRRTITPETPATVVQPAPAPVISTTIDNVAGPTVGVDAAIRAADHIALVVFLRVHALTLSNDLAGFIVRPGLAAQVSF
jgi:hypothetical protein